MRPTASQSQEREHAPSDHTQSPCAGERYERLCRCRPGHTLPVSESRSEDDLVDGGDQTLMLVEVADSGVHWMEPRDLHFSDITLDMKSVTTGPSSHHMGVNVVFANGHAQFLDKDKTSRVSIRAMLTVGGR